MTLPFHVQQNGPNMWLVAMPFGPAIACERHADALALSDIPRIFSILQFGGEVGEFGRHLRDTANAILKYDYKSIAAKWITHEADQRG